MKTLTIKDLPRTAELNCGEMAAVFGGTGIKYTPDHATYAPSTYTPSYSFDSSVHVTQALFQAQANPTGNGSAVFGGGISACNDQLGQNNVFA